MLSSTSSQLTPPPPAYLTSRDDNLPTLGPAAAKLARACGWSLMPAQRQVLDLALTLNAQRNGWRYSTVIVTKPRRGGKTRAVDVALVHRGLAFPRSRSWYTAQTGQDARDHWRDLVEDLSRSPLRSRFSTRRSAGSESMQWRNGSTLRVFSPQPDALHGKDNDCTVIDEGWAFTQQRGRELLQAIGPGQSTRQWRQLWLPSTAGGIDSSWLREWIDKGRASIDDPHSTIAYAEWSCPPDLDPCDPDSWPLFHPSYGITVQHDALVAELERMGPAEFARAYGNVWPEAGDSAQWPPGAWAAACDVDAAPAGNLAFGCDVAMDRSRAAICCASSDGDDTVVELVALVPVTEAARTLAQLRARHGGTVTINPGGPAVTLPDDLTRLRVPFVATSAAEYAAGCAALFDGIVAGTVRVRPHADLDAAAESAGRRPLGDRWAWARAGNIDVSPLTAMTLAVAGATRPPSADTMPAPAWYVPAS